MAHTYTSLPVLSKFKIGDTTYYLKDSEVRTLIDTFGSAVTYNVDTTVTAGSANLVTQDGIAKYVATQIGDLASAMNFRGSFDPVEGQTAEQVLAANITDPASGDVALVGTAEYIYNGEVWKLFGDEGVYATIAGVDSAYVKKTLTIAGVDLADAITADELKTALGLKALAYKENATATVTDYATGITGATYTPAGTINVELTSTAVDMTSTGNFTPEGTISAPSVTVTPATTTFKKVTSAGSLPSVTEAKSAFATAGITAAIDGTDTEMLVFSNASTAQALTSTGFDAGALPTLEDEATTVVTGITSAVATAPTFTGTAGDISVTGSYDKAGLDATKTKFTGTEATITPTLTTGSKAITVE